MGAEPFLLAATLRAVQAQRLVRRLCPECRESYKLDPETAKRVGLEPGVVLYKPKGCKVCNNRGYKGRVGVYEVVPIGPELALLIQTRASLADLQHKAKELGQKFLADAGLNKARQGLTSLEEVMSIALEGA